MDWHRVVWFKGHVPRWAFIEWLECHGSLSTMDRLLRWGIVANDCCILCHGGKENICSLNVKFSLLVWAQILRKWRFQSFPEVWVEVHRCLTFDANASCSRSVMKLGLAANIYHLWGKEFKGLYKSGLLFGCSS